ncbi:MAG: aldo/keto reductase [Gemmatimonadota bacterium]|nr:aldo/keto reductase [Gemmatimonadota bacterium]
MQPLATVQSEDSLWLRETETKGGLEACEELGIGFVPFSRFGKGFLTGKIDETTEFASSDLRGSVPALQRGEPGRIRSSSIC